MKKKLKGILEELDSVYPEKDKHLVLESRAGHIIQSAINILKLIEENYDLDEANDLSRRFLLAIKNQNPKKFETGIQKIKEGKNEDQRS